MKWSDVLRIQSFLAGCQQIVRKHHEEHFPILSVPVLSLERGRRYVRIVSTGSGHRVAWAFVDTTNGDVLKVATWKAPAKHARGNIYDDANGLKHIGPYGPAYLR